MNFVRYLRYCVVFALMANVFSPVFAQASVCGSPYDASTGPWDYRTATAEQRRIVESRHFTANVRMMRRGSTTKNLAGDIAYTLRVLPNHHQALMTMGNWSLKTKSNPPPDGQYTVECWFERAMTFAPDDAMVKVVFGTYLLKRGKSQEAIEQLEVALKQAGSNANVYYNLGLAYVNLKEYDKALANAHTAYRLGFPLPGLKNMLKRVGAWREPSPTAVDAPPVQE
jgi:tetratricopeptide (TPR) repeat protein